MEQVEMIINNGFDNDVEKIKTALQESIQDIDLYKFLSVERLKDGSISIKAKGSLVGKLYFRKKAKSFMAFNVANKKFFEDKPIKDYNEDFLRIEFSSIEDILDMRNDIAKAFIGTLKRFEREAFGCCSRYMECSDAMRCIHPNEVESEACQYKTNLEQGRIFYGKNKNC